MFVLGCLPSRLPAKIVQRVLEGAGQQLSFEIHREEPRAGVDLLATGYAAPPIC